MDAIQIIWAKSNAAARRVIFTHDSNMKSLGCHLHQHRHHVLYLANIVISSGGIRLFFPAAALGATRLRSVLCALVLQLDNCLLTPRRATRHGFNDALALVLKRALVAKRARPTLDCEIVALPRLESGRINQNPPPPTPSSRCLKGCHLV